MCFLKMATKESGVRNIYILNFYQNECYEHHYQVQQTQSPSFNLTFMIKPTLWCAFDWALQIAIQCQYPNINKSNGFYLHANNPPLNKLLIFSDNLFFLFISHITSSDHNLYQIPYEVSLQQINNIFHSPRGWNLFSMPCSMLYQPHLHCINFQYSTQSKKTKGKHTKVLIT